MGVETQGVQRSTSSVCKSITMQRTHGLPFSIVPWQIINNVHVSHAYYQTTLHRVHVWAHHKRRVASKDADGHLALYRLRASLYIVAVAVAHKGDERRSSSVWRVVRVAVGREEVRSGTGARWRGA